MVHDQRAYTSFRQYHPIHIWGYCFVWRFFRRMIPSIALRYNVTIGLKVHYETFLLDKTVSFFLIYLIPYLGEYVVPRLFLCIVDQCRSYVVVRNRVGERPAVMQQWLHNPA